MKGQRSPRTWVKRGGGVLSALGAAIIALSAIPVPVAAGGNPTFLGILDASPPTGFQVSPTAYDVADGPALVDFDVVVKNLTDQTQTVAFTFSLHHILTYNGVDVSDGQPGQPGIAFPGPQGTTQATMPGSQAFSVTWTPNETQTLLHEYSVDTCGYFQIDIGTHTAHQYPGQKQKNRASLASGFIRVLGCTSPLTTPTPSGSVQPTSTATTSTSTPSGQGAGSSTATPGGDVLAASTPGTGAGGSGGGISIGLLILTLGAILLAAGWALPAYRSRHPLPDI